MSLNAIQSYVVTIRYKARGLRASGALIGDLTQARFTPTLTDSEGKVHEPGPHTFGITTALSGEEVVALSRIIARGALHEEPEIKVITFDDWLSLRETQ